MIIQLSAMQKVSTGGKEMEKYARVQVEILLTASDITYQAVKHRSVRAVWQKLS